MSPIKKLIAVTLAAFVGGCVGAEAETPAQAGSAQQGEARMLVWETADKLLPAPSPATGGSLVDVVDAFKARIAAVAQHEEEAVGEAAERFLLAPSPPHGIPILDAIVGFERRVMEMVR